MPICSYCGREVEKTENEHVFPSCLYPKSKAGSTVQRLTVKACRECNGSWSDDEAHFRNVLVLSGDNPNEPRQELWQGPINRSFDEPDGQKRISDLLEIIRPIMTENGERHLIYPGEDKRVLRVVRKVIRGLAHFHGLVPYVSDEKVWADVLKYDVPGGLLKGLSYQHREPDIAEYLFEKTKDGEIHSAWMIRFFEAPTFVGLVYE
jgi:hypothetical protein